MGAQDEALRSRGTVSLRGAHPVFSLAVMSAMRGALQLSRRLRMRVEPVDFTKSRFHRRWNMMDEDRVKWYNWNLACIYLTVVPFVWMYTVNYRTSEETLLINRTLDPMGTLKIKYDL